MNNSGSTRRSAPSSAARARAARAFSALPATSPTVGFSWASVIANWLARSVMELLRRVTRNQSYTHNEQIEYSMPAKAPLGANCILQIAPMRSTMANSQNRPAMTSATPTAAEPISLTRPICGSGSVVSRSASFSIAVLSNSTTSTRTTTAISSTRRIVVAPISHASGSASASATSSSRTACSERMAKARPLRVLIVARQNLSNSQSRCDRHRLNLAAAFLLEQFGDQESHVDRLLGIETGIADRVIAIAEILMGDGARAADEFGDVLPG